MVVRQQYTANNTGSADQLIGSWGQNVLSLPLDNNKRGKQKTPVVTKEEALERVKALLAGAKN